MKPGTMAMVPPTLPPNCGQPQATTANTATAPAASTARLDLLPPTRPGAVTIPAQHGVPGPGGGEDAAHRVQPHRFAADAVEPARFQDRQPERRSHLQPRPGDHVEADHGDRQGRYRARRPERIPAPRPAQRDDANHGRPGRGEPVQPDGGVRQLPPRHQVGQERAGRHRGQHGPGDPPPGGPVAAARGLRPPPEQADADTGGRVQQGVRPEEDRVRARPHLGRGVLADQAAHGGGGGAPAGPGDLRPHHVRGDRLATPAQHGGVRSVSTTIPGCRVDSASSRPVR